MDKIKEWFENDNEPYDTMPNTKKEKWIISISNTDGSGIELLNFTGTEDEAKQLLVGLAAKDIEDTEDRFDYGTESVDEIERLDDNALYAYGNYTDFHIDYVAKKATDICEITLRDVPVVIKEKEDREETR